MELYSIPKSIKWIYYLIELIEQRYQFLYIEKVSGGFAAFQSFNADIAKRETFQLSFETAQRVMKLFQPNA